MKAAMKAAMKYDAYPATTIALEEAVLERWREERTFARSLEQTEGSAEFVFYEGPPTANGRPGIHHVISRTIKDLVCRYQTMLGRHVTRIAGWDTHGLPVEIEAEKRLGISGKRQIEAIGVAAFNDACRESVFTYKEDWERLSERIGYWLDYSRPYVTFRPEYIESVWSILARLYGASLIYRGHKSVPYCPRCGTALSSHEVAQGYEDVEDPSLFFIAPLLTPAGGEDPDGRAFLVWTTTPWTLPSNTALALHPALPYVEVEHEGRRLILAEARVEAVFDANARVVGRWTAGELEGMRYGRPFELIPAHAGNENAWRVVLEDFVSAEDGTGIVHMAPAFGSDDYASGQRHGLPLLRPVDDTGRFAEDLPLVGGDFVKDADPKLVDDLAARGLLFRHTLETHSYPHCWRCGSPLIYMARDSWYIRTTAVKDQMLANNARVGWHPPEVGTGRFGEWLEGNVDWAISRERYWGTPLPFWVCDADPAHVQVLASLAELDEKVGGLPDGFDPHKPYIDEPSWPCAECSGTMRRTPEVLDVWFDSGAMPYAQWHYPFENEQLWRRHFPADFICEGVDQTRGWFYSLMAIATMLGDGPAFRNVLVNDLILDAEGLKMSKSRGNVVDPWQAIEDHGADAIRWYLLTVSQPWVPKRFDTAALAESANRVFGTFGNVYRFFEQYANIEAWAPSDADPAVGDRPAIDRWILSRVGGLVEQVRAELDAYEVTRASRAIADFIVEDLSNWYVRRSRDRFYGGGGADGLAAFRTLYDALVTVARLLAPIVPFHSDWVHHSLTGESAHLAAFPTADAFPRDSALERQMAAARTLARLGRAARMQAKIRVRQPLPVLHVVGGAGGAPNRDALDVLRDELNVKEIRFVGDAAELVTLSAQPNFRVLGKRFGGKTQAAAAEVRALGDATLRAHRAGEPVRIEVDGESVELEADAFSVVEAPRGELIVESDEGYTVALDCTVDEALRLEGLARELNNRIQRLRRDAGLEVSDRILLGIAGDEEILRAIDRHGDWLAGETLAVELRPGAGLDDEPIHEVEVDGRSVRIAIARA